MGSLRRPVWLLAPPQLSLESIREWKSFTIFEIRDDECENGRSSGLSRFSPWKGDRYSRADKQAGGIFRSFRAKGLGQETGQAVAELTEERLSAMNVWKQLRAILLLPGMVTVAIPAIILYFTGLNWLPSPWSIVLPVVGFVFVILGLILMVGQSPLHHGWKRHTRSL